MSPFFRNLADILQQPTALAMLGSMGVHLMLSATLPAFMSSTEPRSELEVRRVQFVPPPQGSSAAPQPSTSQLGLPPIPNAPNSKVQLPVVGQGTSPVPNPLYTIPDLTPIPIPVPSQTQTASQNNFSELLRRLAAQQRQAPTFKISKARLSPVTPPPNPPTTPIKPADPTEVARSTTPPAPNTQPQTPNTQPSNIQPQTTAPQPTANDRFLIATRYNPEGTFQPGDVKPFNDFMQLTAKRGIAVNWGRDYIRVRQPQEPLRELPYPLSFALNNYEKRQHPAVVAVFIGRDGKPIPNTKPEIVNSTGYQILNDKAIELVQQEANQPNRYPAIADDRVRVYVYEFQFKTPNSGTASTPQQRT